MCTRHVGRHVPNKNGPTGRRQARAAGRVGECRGAWSCARYLETDKVDITDLCEGKRAERSRVLQCSEISLAAVIVIVVAGRRHLVAH